MTGNQVQIALNSAMDTDSDDLIRAEAAFKKKNSYLFNGVLSNLTSERGNGVLSTTGKEIEVKSDGIHTGNIVFPLPEELKTVNDYENIDSYKDCLFARRLNNGLAYIRRPSNTTLFVHTPDAEFGLAASDTIKLRVDNEDHKAYPYSINGFITQNRNTGFEHSNLLLVTKHYYAKDVNRYYNKYEMYDLTGILLHTWEDEYVYENHPYREGNSEWSFGDKFTAYVRTKEIDGLSYNYIYWGFDDNDMRRRFLFRTYYYYNPEYNLDLLYNSTEVDELIENSDNVEPLYNKAQFVYSTVETTELNGQNVSNLGVLPICRGFGLISDKGYVYGEPIVERIPQNQNPNITRGRGLWNTKTRELANGVLVCEVPNSSSSNKYWNGSAYATDSISRYAMNNGLGDNPITYNAGTQPGKDNFAATKFTQYVDNDDNTSYGYFYNWILSINLNEDENYQVIQAVGDSDLLPGSITHITFFNYADPIGNFKSNPELDEQVFPHMRFFMNVQEDRGIYWDYGKGWNSMYVDQLYINKYTSYGVAVWETPLALIYNTAENKFTDNLNLTKHNYDNKYLRILDNVASETTVEYNTLISKFELKTDLVILKTDSAAYPTNSKLAFVREAEFQGAITTIVPAEGDPYYVSQIFRLHPISITLRSNNSYVNHAWTGFANSSTMGIISHTFDLDEHLQLGVYASVPTALSAYNTLLFTPQDLESNYSFDINDNGYFITRYSADSIESVVIKNDATYQDISVSKLADYEFRTNMLDTKNLIVEDHTGNFSIERAFYPYLMDSIFNNYYPISNPLDSSTPASNGSWYFGAGKNFRLNGDESESSTFLLAPFVLSIYVLTSETDKFNKLALDNRYGKLISDLWCFGPGDEVDEFYTFNRKTTNVEYKNTRYINEAGIQLSKYKPEYAGTSWWAGAQGVVIYPVGIVSKVDGVDYTTPTVDAGNNYSARFYRNTNKTFLVFNQNDMVYFGNRIFTIMSGNYYFDGQGIYYLGSRDDYSQNIFTAYAIGMKFLANSSAEAYFYSDWDKSLYLYTASNTLQKSQSFAAMGKIVDSLYSSSEQALYILFDDGRLYVKTQTDSAIIENVKGNKLQSTAYGAQILDTSDTTYEIYNPHLWSNVEHLSVETGWLGNQDAIQKYPYVDIILQDVNRNSIPKFKVSFDVLDGKEVRHIVSDVSIMSYDWNNQLLRARINPSDIEGCALKVKIDSDDLIHIFSISVRVIPTSNVPGAPSLNIVLA